MSFWFGVVVGILSTLLILPVIAKIVFNIYVKKKKKQFGNLMGNVSSKISNLNNKLAVEKHGFGI